MGAVAVNGIRVMSSQSDALQPDSGPDGGIAQHDERSMWRCPQLGGPVTFGYCRQMNDALPCSRIVRCWGEILDVEGFLDRHYDAEQVERISSTLGRGRLDIISETLRRVLNPQQGEGERNDAD